MYSRWKKYLPIISTGGIVILLFIALLSSDNVELFGTAGVSPDTQNSVELSTTALGLSALPDWNTVTSCNTSCVPYVLYHTDETADWEIYRLNSADSNSQLADRQNLSYGKQATDIAPSISPDGNWIVFSSDRDSSEGIPNWELYVASATGDPDTVHRITFNTFAADTDPVWGPNNYVVFESSRDGNWEIYMLDMETGQEYRLTNHSSDDLNPSWSPDGTKLLFESNRDGLWQLYELTLGSRMVRRITDGTAVAHNGGYSPHGEKITYLTYPKDSDNSVIYVMGKDGSDPVAITSVDENASNQSWSPDGDMIAYQSDLDGDLDVYIYQLSTDVTRQLTNNTVADYAPTWRCSNSHIVFTSDIMGNADIFEADADAIEEDGLKIEADENAFRLTFGTSSDIYPQDSQHEENASNERVTSENKFGQLSLFIDIEFARLDVDPSVKSTEWQPISTCSA